MNDCGCASGTPGKGFCMADISASDISGCYLAFERSVFSCCACCVQNVWTIHNWRMGM